MLHVFVITFLIYLLRAVVQIFIQVLNNIGPRFVTGMYETGRKISILEQLKWEFIK